MQVDWTYCNAGRDFILKILGEAARAVRFRRPSSVLATEAVGFGDGRRRLLLIDGGGVDRSGLTASAGLLLGFEADCWPARFA
jgi:hypothetical protein